MPECAVGEIAKRVGQEIPALPDPPQREPAERQRVEGLKGKVLPPRLASRRQTAAQRKRRIQDRNAFLAEQPPGILRKSAYFYHDPIQVLGQHLKPHIITPFASSQEMFAGRLNKGTAWSTGMIEAELADSRCKNVTTLHAEHP